MYLKIGDTDVSGYINEDSYVCRRESVYSGGFVNIYGEKVQTRTGERIEIEAELTDVTDEDARALQAAVSGGGAQTVFMAPSEMTAYLSCERLDMSIERDREGLCWTVRIKMSGYVRDGL
ncbi:MAG: hypothetical protein IJ080_07140 [Oscillospiraceae bacterium]|nr:hypothetical protein [Oscillospiraceae bacterium]